MTAAAVAPSRAEAADVILARLADGTIARGTWAGRTADGRDTACLIAVIVPGLAPDARPVGAEHLLPPWLAELTGFVNDAPPTDAAWPVLVRRYAEALRASDVLTPEAWRRLDYRCRRAALIDALACAGPAKQVVERSIALCDRTIAGDPPTPEECRAARIAARAAVVSGASEAAARAAEDRVRSALEVCCCAADAAATAAGKRAVNRVDEREARGFRYGFDDAGFAAWKQEVSAAGDRIFGAILDAWEGEICAATGGGESPAVATAAAAVEELAAARAEIAALNRQVCRLVSGQEIEGDRLCQHLAELALLAADRAANAVTARDLSDLLAAARAEIAELEVDVKRHLKSFAREREIAMQLDREVRSLRAELAAACAVPADVESAIASLDAAAYRRGRDPVKVGGPPSATAAARVEARAGLQAVREAHSGALTGLEEAARLELEAAGLASYGDSPETTARQAHIFAAKCVKRAVAAEARLREIEAKAAPATVGDYVIEYADPIAPSVWIGPEKPTHKIRQLRAGRVRSWSSGGGWDAWGTAMMRVDFDLPARLITDAAEAEADPASRWPIAAKETDDAR